MANNDVNIIISVQNEASKQIEQVQKDVNKLTKSQMSATAVLKRDHEQASTYYTKLDAERLRESERLNQGKLKLEKALNRQAIQLQKQVDSEDRRVFAAKLTRDRAVYAEEEKQRKLKQALNRQAIQLQKQMDSEDRRVFAAKLARDRAVYAEEEKQRKLKLKQEQLLAKQQLAMAKQVEKAKIKAAKEAAAIELQTIRATERAEKGRIATLMSVSSLFRQMSGLFGKLGLGGLGGGYLAYRGFDDAKEGARAEEIKKSFENTFGKGSGSVLSNIRDTIKGTVNDMSIMKEAIKQNIEGVDPNRMNMIFKLGALASQKFGLDTEEGIGLARKAIVEFDESAMKDLGILNKRDASYQTYLKVLDKSSKSLNAFAKINMQNAYVQERMNAVYGENAKVLDDNFMAFQKLGAQVKNLGLSIGHLLASSFGPMASHLADMASGVAQLLTSFDPKTGIGKIGKGLANILGPNGIETIRQIAGTIIDLTNFIKGFVSGFSHMFGSMVHWIYKIFGLSDKSSDSWKKLGEAAGKVFAVLSLAVTPMSLLASFSFSILGNITKTLGMAFRLSKALGMVSVAERSAAAGAAAETLALSALLGVPLAALTGYGIGLGINELTGNKGQMGEKLYDLLYNGSKHPLENANRGLTANSTVPTTHVSQSPNVVINNDDLAYIMHQTNAHLKSIDSKTNKTNALEQHIYNKPTH